MIVYNARIHILDKDNTVYENGFIEFDSKIIRSGDMRDCPPLSERDYNAKGAFLYPGFVDPHSHVGVWGNAEGFEGDDGNETTDPVTPHLRGIDMVNPTDLCFTEAARAGVTTVMCGPGSANPVSGTFFAMKTAGSPRIDNRVLKNPTAMKFAFGENPKTVYRERSETPVTRMATAAIIREQLYKAKRYLKSADEHRANPADCDLPDYDMKCEALLPLLRGEIAMHAHCHRADDVFTAMRIGEEFGLKPVIVHGTDAALIADELAKGGVPVIIGPVICDRSKPELLNHSIETAGILAEKGVNFAICTDHPVVPVQYLPLSVGIAVRGGLDVERGLRAITIDAARICGIDDRAGSLENGKDADLVLFDGNFCEVTQIPKAVFIDGAQLPTD